MMSAINSMVTKLSTLPIYDLNIDGSLVMAELLAYNEGFALLQRKLDELERECFISTAESFGISLKERVYSSIKDDLTLAQRREMLIYRYSVTSNDFNKESIEKALVSAGIRCYIIENPSQKSIYINCLERFDTMISQNASQSLAEKFLPAHLEYTFDFRPLQWSQIEAKDLTFQQMDDADLTWDQIDNYQG